MKVFRTIFAFKALFFFIGVNWATAQEVNNQELSKAEYHKLTSADVAKIQSQNFKEALMLDDTQVLRVYELMLKVEKNMETITQTFNDQEAKMAEIKKWEALKSEKLKEILTTEQFTSYINTFKNNKR